MLNIYEVLENCQQQRASSRMLILHVLLLVFVLAICCKDYRYGKHISS